jgi:hypothetical protein
LKCESANGFQLLPFHLLFPADLAAAVLPDTVAARPALCAHYLSYIFYGWANPKFIL